MECLPAELIHQIASILRANEVFALAQTSQHIRRSCWDAWTLCCVLEKTQNEWQYQTLNLNDIKRRSSKDASVLQRYDDTSNNLRTWLEATRIFMPGILLEHYGLDTTTMAKYAMADCKALRLCEQLDQQAQHWRHDMDLWTLEAEAFAALSYIPQLLVLKHPCLHAPGLLFIFWHICTLMNCQPLRENRESEVSVEAMFAVSALLASQDVPIVKPSGRLQGQSPAFEEELCKLLRLATYHLEQVEDNLRLDHALMLVGVVSSLLRNAFRLYKVRRMIGSAYYSFLLPFVVEMPLEANSTWRTVPVPFESGHSQRSWIGWITACAESLLDSIDDGEWVGIVGEVSWKESCLHPRIAPRRGASLHQFDAPMTNIHFSSREGQAGRRELTAHGTDSYGHFSLGGYGTSDGAMKLVKWYRNGAGIGYDWRVRMTPFGIVGVWGVQNVVSSSFRADGVLYLWKKSWTFKDGVVRA